MTNKSELARAYSLSRTTVVKLYENGPNIPELAKRGIAIYPFRVKRLLSEIDHTKFDNLSSFPPHELSEDEKEWLRTCYSSPEGGVIDPRPRAGALNGVYYDEKKKRWFARPYERIPG